MLEIFKVNLKLFLFYDAECLSYFEFTKQDIIHWCHIFGFPDTMKTLNHHVGLSTDALCFVLR